jgi:hypothetical protein
MSKIRNVRLSTGFEVPIDGDLLAIIEALYKEVTLGNVLNSSFETMRSEIMSVIDQMSAAERRASLAESLFLNSVTYENEMLSAYVRRLGAAAPSSPTARKATPARRPAGAAVKKKTAKNSRSR